MFFVYYNRFLAFISLEFTKTNKIPCCKGLNGVKTMEMRAILIQEPGGPEQLMMGTVPRPEPGDRELLVKVHATALNRADLLQREGKYPPPPGASPILGLEMAGVVEEVGPLCAGDWKPGDRVFGLLPGGGYAEYVSIPEALALPVPEGMSMTDAAAIPEAFLTAYQCLYWIGELKQGETVLIHAGASGVGTAAIQLAKSTSARVIATVGTEEKKRFCLRLGADHVFNYRTENFDEALLKVCDGADVVLDFVGASYWKQNIRVLRTDGRWVLISMLGGSKLEQMSLAPILAKRLSIKGTTLRSRSLDYKSNLTRAFADSILPQIEKGQIKPVIDRIFSWHEVQAAHRYMGENQNIGKLVLVID